MSIRGWSGIEDVRKAFREISETAERRSVRRGLKRGAEVFASRIAAAAPRDTGDLAQSWEARNRGTGAGVFTGKRSRWHFQEFGTVKDPADPYIRPTIDSSMSEAQKAIATQVQDDFAKEIAKLARRRMRELKKAAKP